jgi:CIC family chloride channel protein
LDLQSFSISCPATRDYRGSTTHRNPRCPPEGGILPEARGDSDHGTSHRGVMPNGNACLDGDFARSASFLHGAGRSNDTSPLEIAASLGHDASHGPAERFAQPSVTPRRLVDTMRRLSDWIVRFSIRFSPTEAQRTFGVTLLVGAGCGLLAVAFHLTIVEVDARLISRAQRAARPTAYVLTLLCPALGGLVAGLLLTYAFPAARGSGIPQVKAAYAVRTERIRLRDGAAKFAITTLQLGSGASLGREGPTVHMCAALASALGRWFALSPRSVRRLLPVGAAAGVAAAFNAPIAAVTFTVEEIVGKLDQTVLSGVVVAAALAAVIEHSVLGSPPIFTLLHPVGLESARQLPLYALLGVLAGLAAVGFNGSLIRLRSHFLANGALPGWAKPAVGGLVTGACAVAGLWFVQSEGVAGGGYPQLSLALNGALPLVTLLVLGGLKLVATLFSYSSGGAGGIFAPVLFLGAMLGGAVGYVDQAAFGHSQLGAFALVGMGAHFAGVLRAPITSVLIIFEMTGGYGLVLPLMIANTTAYAVARRFDANNLYDALLHQDGIRLLDAPESVPLLNTLRVEQAMTNSVVVLRAEQSVAHALAEVEARPFSMYPVVDPRGRCLGLISSARMRRVVAERAHDTQLSEIVRLREYVHPDDPLIRAVVRMNAVGTRHLPVVARGEPMLSGLLTMSDIFRLQALAANESDGNDPVAKASADFHAL